MDVTVINLSEARRGPWAEELRSTMALAWPLILANLTQQLIQATDILLMGRLGATQLAAATLALNLTFTFNLFLLGLLIASSPMMATALGQRFNAVRDVRRYGATFCHDTDAVTYCVGAIVMLEEIGPVKRPRARS